MLRASRSVDLGGLAAIVFAGMVLAACASVFETSLPPETFKGDSAPKLVRVSLLGGGSDIILSRPVLVGDSIVGVTQTPLLAMQVRTHVLRADSTGRLAIPVTDIRRMVAEPSAQSKGNAGMVLGGIVLLTAFALYLSTRGFFIRHF
jgi:hypothetical protein